VLIPLSYISTDCDAPTLNMTISIYTVHTVHTHTHIIKKTVNKKNLNNI